jgi:pimeloyl-ACP methyl ester carboxylesterase
VHERRWTGAIETHPAPLHVIWGDLDPVAVWPMAERVASVRTDATLTRLDGVGHYPMVETPARFNAALEQALGGVELGSCDATHASSAGPLSKLEINA